MKTKKLFLTLPVAMLMMISCGSDSNVLDERLEDAEDFDAAAASFSDGGATSGEQYFFGVLAEVVEVDVKLREIEKLDEADSEVAEFNRILDSAEFRIDNTREALKLYKDKDWPKRGELHDLTIEWLAAAEMLVQDHLRGLAEPMSRPDDTWTDDEIAAYDEYASAEEIYFDIDNRWVDFQFVFADANGFQLSTTETIDANALADEELEGQ